MLDIRHVSMAYRRWNVDVLMIRSSHSEVTLIASTIVNKPKRKWADGLSSTYPEPLGDVTRRLSSFGHADH
jgi:hypothetical protein